MRKNRAAFSGFVAFIVVSLAVAVWEARADTIMPPEDYRIEIADIDYTGSGWNFLLTSGGYGGGGVEPMLDVHLTVTKTGAVGYMGGYTYDCTFEWDQVVKPRGELPAGFDPGNDLVPVEFRRRAECQGATYGINVDGNDYEGNQDLPEEVGPVTIYARLGDTISVTLRAHVSAYVTFNESDGTVKESWALVDPFLYVDPSYEYASWFGVYGGAPGSDPSTWMEVSRDWMNPASSVPLPGAALPGLCLLTFLWGVRRRKAARIV